MNEEEYKKAFGVGLKNTKKVAMALDHALDIRKFEIELYWKRAGYFWALIASAFAAHFVILGAESMPEKEFYAYVAACVGIVFTFAWLQVNRGSKQWQENWENHVDMLEDQVIGPLYKTVLRRPAQKGPWLERWITGPADISVSKTNQIVSVFTILVWVMLALNVLGPIDLCKAISEKHMVVAAVTIAACASMVVFGRTHIGNYTHDASLRVTKISG